MNRLIGEADWGQYMSDYSSDFACSNTTFSNVQVYESWVNKYIEHLSH